MGIGVSITLIAIGLIMAFAMKDAEIAGIDLNTVGIILAVCGVLGLIITLVIFAPRKRTTVTTSQPPQDQYPQEYR